MKTALALIAILLAAPAVAYGQDDDAAAARHRDYIVEDAYEARDHLEDAKEKLRAAKRGVDSLIEEMEIDHATLEEQRERLERTDRRLSSSSHRLASVGGTIEDANERTQSFGDAALSMLGQSMPVLGPLGLAALGVTNRKKIARYMYSAGSGSGRRPSYDDGDEDPDDDEIDRDLETIADKAEARRKRKARRKSLRGALETSIDNGGGRQ